MLFKIQLSHIVTMASLILRLGLLIVVSESVYGQGRVNMGYPIDIDMAPYMAQVMIKYNDSYGLACDGTILNDQYILTAGHCKD